jgi:hypothetical protein
MKLFKIYLIVAAIVIAFVGISRFFSPSYMVKETIVVNKPLTETFSYISNLKKWEEWSLWDKKLDSTLLFYYNTKYDTLGAKQYISGTLLGKGFIETIAYKKDTAIAYHMKMREGDMTANGIFELTALSSTQTQIAWIDTGNVGNNPIKRYLIPSVTKNTSQTFKDGLIRIKAAIEK